ncbi:MAG TPA: cation diffusion facilitator family transporter [Candidatus Dormibacteraeota bacterium]|nr:cation diffusion facilitator family transporter [Candidatus Dormibacteraeota bacterium]
MAVEAVAGVLAHSLALLSDAAHMVADAGALLLSLVALRLAARPPAGGLTYGLKRAEILSALANGATLYLLAAAIVVEAVRRLLQPPEVQGASMLGVALAGVAVNLLVTWQLARAERRSLNLRGSYQHVLTDLYAFAGTAVAAVVIIATGFVRADAIASLVVAGLMVRAGYGLVRDATRVLLEAAPAGMNAAAVARALEEHPLVVNVHDFHLWEITSGMPALSAHVLVRPGEDCHAVRRQLEQVLDRRFAITHTTLQVEHVSTPERGRLLDVRPRPGTHPERGRA